MIVLYSEEDFKIAKSGDKLKCQCEICNKIFFKMKRDVIKVLNGKKPGKYCSPTCHGIDNTTKLTITCTNCNKVFKKIPSQIRKNNFCSSSCAATYNNKHKFTGNRRSKLEAYLEIELIRQYPDLEFQFNQKNIINSELDIYVPSLKLAFELNGIFHYEPIYGENKLNQIQNNDHRKFQACLEQGIELCLIDTSQQKYFKEQTSQKYLNIIINIIKERLLTS